MKKTKNHQNVTENDLKYLQRMITGVGLRAFGPFLIPLLCLEICMIHEIKATVNQINDFEPKQSKTDYI